MLSQVRFNRVPEKIPEKLPEKVPEKNPEKVAKKELLGIFGTRPGQQ